jgi:hypothetical protein
MYFHLVPHLQIVGTEIFMALALKMVNKSFLCDTAEQPLYESIYIPIFHIRGGEFL